MRLWCYAWLGGVCATAVKLGASVCEGVRQKIWWILHFFLWNLIWIKSSFVCKCYRYTCMRFIWYHGHSVCFNISCFHSGICLSLDKRMCGAHHMFTINTSSHALWIISMVVVTDVLICMDIALWKLPLGKLFTVLFLNL